MGDAKAKILLSTGGVAAETYYIDSGTDRIMAINHTEQEWSQVAQVVIQDSSHTVADLAREGYKAHISWGYGADYSLCAPLWCIAQKTDSRGGSIITALSLAGTFNLMNEDRASEAYTPDSSNTDTVKDVLTALVEATLTCYSHCKAYVATFDDTSGIIDTFMPKDSFRIYLNDRRLSKIKQLMQHVGYKCRVEGDEEIHFFIPTVSGSSYDEEYDDVVTGHNFFEKGVRKRVIIPGYFVVSSHPDHLSPFAGWTGYAKDTGYDALPTDLQKRDHKYFRVTGNTQCTSIATNLLLHKQMDAEKGHGFAIMNCLQEVFDYVNITDSKVGDTRAGNIGYINRKYLATGRPEDFSMEFRFGSVAPGQYLGTMPPATTGISTAALAIGQMSLWDAVNAIFAGDPETGWLGLAHYLPDFDERITDAKDEITQIEPDAGIPSGGMEGGITWKSLFDGSTDTPTATVWDLEAGLPQTPTGQIFFSPIIDDPSWGQVVYIIDQAQHFWRYALESKTFYEMTSPSYGSTSGGRAFLYRTLAISPNGKKLACCSDGHYLTSGIYKTGGGRRIEIYDIPSNTWSASSILPIIHSTVRGYARAVVWEDNDTLWVWAVRSSGTASGWAGKCIKYVISTDTFTVYTNLSSYASVSANFGNGGAAIKSDKTVVYAGGTDNDYEIEKYTIATDTYTSILIQGGSSHAACHAYDRDKVWYFDDDDDCRQGYLDTADDSFNDDAFAENTDRSTGYGKYCGIHDSLTDIIAHARASIPRMMSAKTGGGYLLGTIYATDWTPILINKPDDNFAISIINAADNVSLSFDHAVQTALWDGTWKFYYPVAGDYTGISIKYGVP